MSASSDRAAEFERGAGYHTAIEVVVVRSVALPPNAIWALGPGGAWRDRDARLVALRIAPDRYLFPDPDVLVKAAVEEAIAAKSCAMSVVGGKWQPFRLAGPRARRVLAVCVDVEGLLDGRDCASTTIFDCPAIIAQQADGYWICVPRSYAASFGEAVGAQLMML